MRYGRVDALQQHIEERNVDTGRKGEEEGSSDFKTNRNEGNTDGGIYLIWAQSRHANRSGRYLLVCSQQSSLVEDGGQCLPFENRKDPISKVVNQVKKAVTSWLEENNRSCSS